MIAGKVPVTGVAGLTVKIVVMFFGPKSPKAAWLAVIVDVPILRIAKVLVPATTEATVGLDDARDQVPAELEFGRVTATAPTPQVALIAGNAPKVGTVIARAGA